MADFFTNNWELWIALAAIAGVITAYLHAKYRDRHITARLAEWAEEDRARVDEINENKGGRDG